MLPKDRLRTDLNHAAAIQIMPAGETPPDVMELGALEVIKQPWPDLYSFLAVTESPGPVSRTSGQIEYYN